MGEQASRECCLYRPSLGNKDVSKTIIRQQRETAKRSHVNVLHFMFLTAVAVESWSNDGAGIVVNRKNRSQMSDRVVA